MSGRIKTLLTPFYKLAHPDVLRQAPEKIQQANSLALATLNSYIDSVNHGDSVQLSSLRFFVPRDKQYTECKVTLLPLKPKVSTKIKDLHLESIVNSINQAITSPEETIIENEDFEIPKRIRMREVMFNDSTEQIRKTLGLQLRDQVKKRYLYQVSNKIEKEYNPYHPSFFGMESRKPNFFIQQAVEQSAAKTLYKSLENNHLNIEKLLLDEVLTETEISQGLSSLAG